MKYEGVRMDWLQEINGFPGFDLNVVSTHIYEDERQKANAKYNKALKNARNDSVDIAIIELRKLSVLYPEAGQITSLLGCCQMLDQKPEDAIKSFKRAQASILPLDLEIKIEDYLQEAKKTLEQKMTSVSFGQAGKYPIRPVSPIVEAKSSRWKKTRVASKREQREVMKQLSGAQKDETMIRQPRFINWMKVWIALGIVLVITGLIVAISIYIPRLIRSVRNTEMNASEKLEWLLNRLTSESEQESAVRRILDEYDLHFYPDASISDPNASKDPYSTEPTKTLPTPSPVPTVNDIVLLAALDIGQAEAIGSDNPKRVYELIVSAREYLEGIDENAVAKGMDITAEEISIKTVQLERSVVNTACYHFYSQGRAAFNEQKYRDAISYHEQAFEINPYYLDGGNVYNLGKAYAEAGEQEKANEAFEFAIEHYPGTELAGWAAARIKP
jgi:tetratricopeptide (TPR) repeat protein